MWNANCRGALAVCTTGRLADIICLPPGRPSRSTCTVPVLADNGVHGGSQQETLRTMRILIVDDEPNIRRTLRTTLEASGHAVEEAATGQDAQGLVEHQAF